MLKIECPECLKSFIWTDDMSLKGKCPTPDCDWRYDVHGELKKTVSSKILEAEKAILCPNCKNPIESRVTLCENCGQFVVGSVTFRKTYLIFAIIIILLALALMFKFWD